MRIELREVGKRFRREWILRQVDLTLLPGQQLAVTGPNGSGKSTLLRLLSGHLTPSRGKITFWLDDRPIGADEVYQYLAYAAPYIDLIEAFTLREAIRFHRRFQPFQAGLDEAAMIEMLALPGSRNKLVRHFSSGMKQRLKLALACCSASPLLLLDEPTTNLDAQGIDWYHSLIDRFASGRTVVVASNTEVDYGFCEKKVDVLEYKQRP